MSRFLTQARRHVTEPLSIMEYNPIWATIFAEEAARIKTRCKDRVIAIDHIGSTSVPGLASKAIIDIAVLVKNWRFMPGVFENMDDLGYTYKGDCGRPGSEYFTRIGFHMHLSRYDSPQYLIKLVFIEYLKNNKQALDEYAELKRMLVKKWSEKPNEVTEYNREKDGFIQDVLKKAGWGDELQAKMLKQVEDRLFIKN